MEIKTLADLSKVIDACRKKGVESIKIGFEAIELRFSAEAIKPARRRRVKEDKNPIQEDPYSAEDILLWSSTGVELPESS